jgi:hypothetical protein
MEWLDFRIILTRPSFFTRFSKMNKSIPHYKTAFQFLSRRVCEDRRSVFANFLPFNAFGLAVAESLEGITIANLDILQLIEKYTPSINSLVLNDVISWKVCVDLQQIYNPQMKGVGEKYIDA